MKASPFEPEEAPRMADRPAAQSGDPAVRAEMRAAPDGPDSDNEEHPADETIDEPGYGHGV